MKSYSLEQQLSQRVILLNAFIFIIMFITFNIILSFWLTHEHDEEIEDKAKILTSLIQNMPNGINFNTDAMPEFEFIIEPNTLKYGLIIKLLLDVHTR